MRTQLHKTNPQWRCLDMCAAVWECVCVAHVYLRGLVEGAVGVNVVIENDDSDHDPHAEQERVLAAETTRILPKITNRRRVKGEEKGWGNHIICWCAVEWIHASVNAIWVSTLNASISKSRLKIHELNLSQVSLLYCLTKGHMMLFGFLPFLYCVVKRVKVLPSEKAHSYFLPQKTAALPETPGL